MPIFQYVCIILRCSDGPDPTFRQRNQGGGECVTHGSSVCIVKFGITMLIAYPSDTSILLLDKEECMIDSVIEIGEYRL
jgi:hypothetical protein